MKVWKKVMSRLLIMALVVSAVGVLPMKKVNADVVCTDIQPQIMEDLSKFSTEKQIVWTIPQLGLEYTETKHYARFTLTEESVVALDSSFTIKGQHNKSFYCTLVSNLEVPDDLAICNDVRTTDWAVLPAGTYYVIVESGWGDACPHSVDICLAAIPTAKAMKITEKKVSYGKKTKITFEDLIKDTNNYHCTIYEGVATAEKNAPIVELLYDENTFTLDKNGTYTLHITFDPYDFYGKLDYWYTFKVTSVDKTKPTVKGVKNGKTYKKKAVIYVKDANGIKQVKVGSKKIKLTKVKKGKYKGYYKFTVTKKGKNTIKVYDKAGNVRTVKIKIKK